MRHEPLPRACVACPAHGGLRRAPLRRVNVATVYRSHRRGASRFLALVSADSARFCLCPPPRRPLSAGTLADTFPFPPETPVRANRRQSDMSILVDRNTKVITQGIT